MQAMIKSVKFHNYKVLRQATLPLGPFNLLIGPNGSGKSTVLKALRRGTGGASGNIFSEVVSAGVAEADMVGIKINWGNDLDGLGTDAVYRPDGRRGMSYRGRGVNPEERSWIEVALSNMPIYTLEPRSLAAPVMLEPIMVLQNNGTNLAGVLDRLRDQNPERFEALNEEMSRWIPEFDRILFDTPGPGQRVVVLRTPAGHKIKAHDLSDGTLLALAMLTIAYVPDPPAIIGFEEPDRGLHPRLLRDVRDALYRLAYPDAHGDKRDPVQVIATTHSPYLLDLFKEHPEEILIAHKVGGVAQFERLSERSDLDDILRDVHLGEAWYSGILGGLPIES